MIVILGLDGLDYTLVQRWRLSALQQHQHGTVTVPIDPEKGVPLSPEVWGSFLCGKHVKPSFKRVAKRLPMLKRLLYKLRGKHVGRINVGFEPLHEPTFLDFTDSYTVNVPWYDSDYANYHIFNQLSAGKLSAAETVEALKRLYQEYTIQFAEALETHRDYELLFGYFPFPDDFQHLFLSRLEDIHRIYSDLNEYVASLAIEDDWLLIVSDHGWDTQKLTHSQRGFYSSNQPIKPTPEHITDFYVLFTDASAFDTK